MWQLNEKKCKESNDVENLINEIELIKKSNTEKEKSLVEFENDNEMLKENLFKLEKANEMLEEQLKHKELKTEHVQILSDELGIEDLRSHNVSIQCDPCGKIFEDEGHLGNHPQTQHENKAKLLQKFRLKEEELKEQIHTQKHKLTVDLVQLRQTEVFENFKCKCRGFCRIFHHKHNWKRSISKEFVDRM